jgi:hypothetical protein
MSTAPDVLYAVLVGGVGWLACDEIVIGHV